MSLSRSILEDDLARWEAALRGARDDPAGLEASFIDRWRRNAPATPPSRLLTGASINAEHGWAASLELFLLSRDERDKDVQALIDAILRAAKSAKPTLEWGDVWIDDLLALRRAPPAGDKGNAARRWRNVDLDTANRILGALTPVATALPAPQRQAYYVFRRAYMSLTNALVSEIVEVDVPGLVVSDYRSGRRVVPPDARSVFRSIPKLHRATEGWPQSQQDLFVSVRRRWSLLIRQLVDTILKLNLGLENVVETGVVDPRILKGFARQFDWALYRLILADLQSRPQEQRPPLETALEALRIIHRAQGGDLSPTANFHQSQSQVHPSLWYGEITGSWARPSEFEKPRLIADTAGASDGDLLVENDAGYIIINMGAVLDSADEQDLAWLQAIQAGETADGV